MSLTNSEAPGGITEEQAFIASNLPLVSGRYYYSQIVGGSHTNAIFSSSNDGEIIFTPFVVSESLEVDRIGLNITSAGTAGRVVRVGMYNDSNGAPGSLLFDGGTVAIDSTGTKEATISETLTPGWYWFASVHNEDTTLVAARGFTSNVENITGSDSSIESGTQIRAWVGGSGVDPTSALPSTAPTIGVSTNAPPIVWVRKT